MTWAGRTAGSPSEILPDEVYIASDDDKYGFLAQAMAFHQDWKLNPRAVRTVYDVLAAVAEGRATRRRIRLVTHAEPDGLFLNALAVGGSNLTDEWLETIAGGSVAVFGRLIGFDIEEWGDDQREILGKLDPAAPFYETLNLADPSPDVSTLLAANALVSALKAKRLVFLPGTSPTAKALFGRCLHAWLEACGHKVGSDVPEATLAALATAVAAAAKELRYEAPEFVPRAKATLIWSRDARSALNLGPRLDVDLAACRRACGPDTTVDIRGCRLDEDTLAAFAALFAIPGQNVSGSAGYLHYPRFGVFQTSWECRTACHPVLKELARRKVVRDAVADFADLIRASTLENVAGGDLVSRWEDLPHANQLIAMLEVWRCVPVTFGDDKTASGYVILDAESDCGKLHAESLDVFLRSIWANPPADLVTRVRGIWLRTGGRTSPVMRIKRGTTITTAVPFEPAWSENIITG